MFIGSCVAAGMLALPLLEFLGEKTQILIILIIYHRKSTFAEVDSLEVTILWTIIMITLYSLMPGTLTVNYRYFKVQKGKLFRHSMKTILC